MSDASRARRQGQGDWRETAQYEPPASQTSRPRARWEGATISQVDPGSPADREGLTPGMVVTQVNDQDLTDVIVWDWEADERDVHLEGIAGRGTPDEFEFECDLHREFGQDWGITFDGAIFDGTRTCRNDCTFCFMKMLPKGMRRTLYLRDDDYRLSFLQGNFVTLTNMSEQDVSRVIDLALSPLNVSLHAVTPEVRQRLIGRNERRGMEVLERLVGAGIEIHAQVVLVPGENDGDELIRTLDYVQARPQITSLGIVPLGYTRFQSGFTSSYSSDPASAARVIDAVAPYQRRSRQSDGRTRYQLADEFYLIAGREPPAGADYDGYPQYYDGIGMVRSFLDDLDALLRDPAITGRLRECAGELARQGRTLTYVCGVASEPLARRAVENLGLGEVAEVFVVTNEYFGGNVDVTGLLTSSDVRAQLPASLTGRVVVLPEVMFNTDALTLDGDSRAELGESLSRRGATCVVAPGTPEGMARAAIDAAAQKSR
ncbi:MAG: DUF512 domain-containing protein [Coriobacteriales bacterium]